MEKRKIGRKDWGSGLDKASLPLEAIKCNLSIARIKMRKNNLKKQKPAIIFLLIFFIIIGLLILSVHVSWKFFSIIWAGMYTFIIRNMINNYRRGWFPKNLFLNPSSYISIKKHPIRWKINLIFWNAFYGGSLIYILIKF